MNRCRYLLRKTAVAKNEDIMSMSANDSVLDTRSRRTTEVPVPRYAMPKTRSTEANITEAEDHMQGTLVTTLSSSGKSIYCAEFP